MKLEKQAKITSELGYMCRYVDSGNRYHIRKYRIVRETPKGFWIKFHTRPYREKWVAKEGKNNFAKRTEKEALESYYHRKLSHLGHLHQKKSDVENILAELSYKLGKPEFKPPNVFDLDGRCATSLQAWAFFVSCGL